MLQRKFDEFLKELNNQQYRIHEVNQSADRLLHENHPDVDTINQKRDELNDAWHRLSTLAATRKEALFGAHEVQRFNRDSDETIAWINEKDAALSGNGNDNGTLFTCSLLSFYCNVLNLSFLKAMITGETSPASRRFSGSMKERRGIWRHWKEK